MEIDIHPAINADQHAIEEDTWREVVGSKSMFEVSNSGEIRKTSTGKIVKQTSDHNGRLCCGVLHGETRKIRKVHIMVAEAFIGPRPDGYKILMADGNNKNCNIFNIKYISPEEVQDIRANNATVAPSAKLNPRQVIEIRRLINNRTKFAHIAEDFKISYGTVKKISSRITWNHIV